MQAQINKEVGFRKGTWCKKYAKSIMLITVTNCSWKQLTEFLEHGLGIIGLSMLFFGPLDQNIICIKNICTIKVLYNRWALVHLHSAWQEFISKLDENKQVYKTNCKHGRNTVGGICAGKASLVLLAEVCLHGQHCCLKRCFHVLICIPEWHKQHTAHGKWKATKTQCMLSVTLPACTNGFERTVDQGQYF